MKKYIQHRENDGEIQRCLTTLEAGGGEYPAQDGFGWTNGVYLALDDVDEKFLSLLHFYILECRSGYNKKRR